ncbi:HAD-IA family hydrolase [Kineococcus auxinigenes]|uniref:HAD-IA family hydrolase n=1 Tax=unclassified Kineococcus TaxID=2621656 RepID=UPI003D7E2501
MVVELFSSAFCGPCRSARAVLTEAVRLVPRARLTEVDVAEEPARGRAAGITSTPTVLVRTDDGTEVFRSTGTPSLAQALAALARATPPAEAGAGAGEVPWARRMTPAAVVFDLDGTLLDHPAATLAGLRGWVGSLGLECTAEVEAAWAAAEERHFRAWREGEIGFAEQRRRRLRDVLPLLGVPVGDDAALDAMFTGGFLRAYERAWAAYDDVGEALEAVRAAGLRTAVLTNGPREQQNAKIEAIGLTGRLGPVLTAEELGVAKPRPEAFLAACERLGVAPGRTLHVGDEHAVDVLGARAAGLRAVHLDRSGTGPAGEGARITTLLELAAHLAADPAPPA